VTDPLLDRLGQLANQAKPFSLTSAPAEDRAILAPLLRTGRLAPYRLLDVICPNDHRLAQVLTTTSGPLVVGWTRAFRGYSVDGFPGPPRRDQPRVFERRHRGQPVIYLLARLLEDEPVDVTVQCRCRQRDLPAQWMADQIAAGGGRVVWDG